MGQAKSKALKYPQHPQPPGYPTQGPVYPYGVLPQVGYSSGYHGPVIPPGYGGPVAMPQPQLFQQRERRRKKKRRKTSGSSTGYTAPYPPDQRRNVGPTANVQPAPPGMLDNLPPGFVPTNIMPNPPAGPGNGPVIPPVFPGGQGNRPPPLFTPGVSDPVPLTTFPSSEHPIQRRAATPYISASRPVDESDDDEESDDEEPHLQEPSHRRSQSHHRSGSTSHHFPHTLQPIHPNDPIASPGVLPNPLPQPPRDVYTFTPYKRLLHLADPTVLPSTIPTNPQPGYVNPSVSVNRSVTNPGMAGVGAGLNAAQPTIKKKKRGLFLFGGRRSRDPPPQTAPQSSRIQFVPIYQDRLQSQSADGVTYVQPIAGPSTGPGTMHAQGGAPVPPIPTPPSPPAQRSPPTGDSGEGSDEKDSPAPNARHSMTPHHTPHSHSQSHQPQSHPFYQVHSRSQSQPQSQSHAQPSSSSPPQPYFVSANGSVIEFSQRSLPDFLNHSPHRVMYGNKLYPTAMHLHEAMKFMDHKPELAEEIRRCQSVEEVYPLAANRQVWVRTDWGSVFLDKMEEVLWHKFTQHPHLRTMLLKTGNSRIVYADPQDPYWGSGSQYGQAGEYHGTNYLGMLLEKVRDRLRAGGYS